MWSTLQLISPIFGLALIGYLSGWIGLIEKDGIRGLSRFAFRVAIPVMLIRAVSEIALSFEWELLTAYFGGTFVVYAVGMLVGRFVFGQSPERQAVFGFGSGFSNAVMVGIPFVQVAFGDEGLLPLYIILSIHAPTLYLVGTSMLRIGRGSKGSAASLPMAVLGAQAKNPIVIALAIGFTLNLTGVRMTGSVDAIAGMLADAALPCMLFTLGASLSGYRLVGQLKQAVALVCLKNVLHPIIVYGLAFYVFDLNPVWAAVTVIMAALPMGMNTYLFAEDSEVMAPTIAAAVVLSTSVSVVSLSVVLFLLS
jgi:malonate transporter